jgi:hypothetical protein
MSVQKSIPLTISALSCTSRLSSSVYLLTFLVSISSKIRQPVAKRQEEIPVEILRLLFFDVRVGGRLVHIPVLIQQIEPLQ